MNAIAIIPARYASTRLPGKPLLAETGKPLIQHVVEAVRQADAIARVVVATDDERIFDAVEAFGGEVVMTRADHGCGTDRINEAAELLDLPDEQLIVNVQGDEPDIPHDALAALVRLMEDGRAEMATLATPLPAERAGDPNRVKVALALDGGAMYFSRSPIPFDRDAAGRTNYLLHLGVYAYRVGFLRRFASLPPTPAEQSEKLEQLRALEYGHRIIVATVDYEGAGIDTPEDYAAFVKRCSGED